MPLIKKVLALVEILLRVPPLFVVDELLKLSLDFPPYSAIEQDDHFVLFSNITGQKSSSFFDLLPYDMNLVKGVLVLGVKLILCCLGCIAAACMFVLRTKQLIIVYTYLISVGLVFLSYWTNVATMKQVIALTSTDKSASSLSMLEDLLNLNLPGLFDHQATGIAIMENYVLQLILSLLFYVIYLGPRHWALQYILPLSFTMPSILAALPLPVSLLQHAPVFAALVPLAYVQFILWSSTISIMHILFMGYHHCRNVINNFGLPALIESEWARMNVPNVLRLFWILRVTEHAIILLMDNYELSDEGFKIASLLGIQTLASMAKSLLISGCETVTAILGMTSVISVFCQYMGDLFQWILIVEEEEDKNFGAVSAILFYILALQTGLTSLNPEKRFVRLCRNFCLLFTALMHFVHNIVSPILMSLSASHNPSMNRHVRALGVSMFLILFPLGLLWYLWSNHTVSTWLLAVSAFSIEVIIKIMVSLVIYILFLIDARRTTFWEKLDDYVYYIKAFGNTIEFCFGIFLFFNGAWILLFESGGTIRALMMCIHAYFNIWCEANAGWMVFIKRRSAVNKINSLPEASPAQLERLDDVCAICYQDMSTAKITKCNHFFHGVCLRKWLYVEDRCPLCHEILYKFENKAENREPINTNTLNPNLDPNAR